jgi:hypothetical protein
VTPLEDDAALRAFLADGGRALIVRRRDLPRVEAIAPVEVRDEARRGRRALVVVTPRDR